VRLAAGLLGRQHPVETQVVRVVDRFGGPLHLSHASCS
jgi:hypothetical protein